jgi:hypothetical protein
MSALAYVLAASAGLAGAGVGVAGVLGLAGAAWSRASSRSAASQLTLDPLAGLFLALVGISTAAAVALRARRSRPGSRRALAYLAFVGALGVVPLAANA